MFCGSCPTLILTCQIKTMEVSNRQKYYLTNVNFLLMLLTCAIFRSLGDLFVDGKVIRRPQYDYSDRQQNTRTRSRPRNDRRRERIQNVDRAPIQTQRPNWAQDNAQATQQPMSMNNPTTRTQGDNSDAM